MESPLKKSPKVISPLDSKTQTSASTPTFVDNRESTQRQIEFQNKLREKLERLANGIDSDRITQAYEALMSIYEIDEKEAVNLLKSSTKFNALLDKNEDALNHIIKKTASKTREKDGLTLSGLVLARTDKSKFDYIKLLFQTDDELTYFITHFSKEFSELSEDDIADCYGETSDAELLQMAIRLEIEQEDFYANLPALSGSSGGDWAFGSIRNEAKRIASSSSSPIFQGSKYTIHHKVSRSNLKGLHADMMRHSAVSTDFSNALLQIGATYFNNATSTLKILLNLPFNLEVGPSGSRVIGDPGSGFDPSVINGAHTPRSNELSTFDSSINGRTNQVTTRAFWQQLTRQLTLLEQLHATELAGSSNNLLSDPKPDQWNAVKGNKFIRDK